MLSAIGASFFLILPLFLGVLADTFGLDDQQLGMLGSAYLAAFTLVSTSAVIWVDRLARRMSTAMGLLGLVLACGLLLAAESYSTLMVLVAAIGASAGGVFAVALRVLAATPDPDRAFGLKLFAEQVLGAALIFLIPLLFLPRWGLAGLVGAVVVTFVLLGLSAVALLDAPSERHEPSTDTRQSRFTLTAWLGLAGLAVFMLGLSGVWAFAERLGADGGLSVATIGTLLAVGLMFGAVGAATAAVLGNRFGHRIPHVGGTVLLLICLYLLAGDIDALHFGIAASLLSGLWNYLLAYQMGAVARLDAGGRLSVLIAPAIALGASVGPGLAGWLKTGPSYSPILWLGVASVLLALVVFWSLAGAGTTGPRVP